MENLKMSLTDEERKYFDSNIDMESIKSYHPSSKSICKMQDFIYIFYKDYIGTYWNRKYFSRPNIIFMRSFSNLTSLSNREKHVQILYSDSDNVLYINMEALAKGVLYIYIKYIDKRLAVSLDSIFEISTIYYLYKALQHTITYYDDLSDKLNNGIIAKVFEDLYYDSDRLYKYLSMTKFDFKKHSIIALSDKLKNLKPISFNKNNINDKYKKLCLHSFDDADIVKPRTISMIRFLLNIMENNGLSYKQLSNIIIDYLYNKDYEIKFRSYNNFNIQIGNMFRENLKYELMDAVETPISSFLRVISRMLATPSISHSMEKMTISHYIDDDKKIVEITISLENQVGCYAVVR